MLKRQDSVEGKIAAILQEHDKQTEAALKQYKKDCDKILDILLKSRFGIKITDVERMLEFEKRRKEKIAAKKLAENSTKVDAGNSSYPHPDFNSEHTEKLS